MLYAMLMLLRHCRMPLSAISPCVIYAMPLLRHDIAAAAIIATPLFRYDAAAMFFAIAATYAAMILLPLITLPPLVAIRLLSILHIR